MQRPDSCEGDTAANPRAVYFDERDLSVKEERKDIRDAVPSALRRPGHLGAGPTQSVGTSAQRRRMTKSDRTLSASGISSTVVQ